MSQPSVSRMSTPLDVAAIRRDFPILERRIHGRPLVYLDSAASSQKPLAVIEAISNYYKTSHANIHRGVYVLSEEATLAYEQAHERVARFINADFEEVIFTKNTTEALNLVAYAWGLRELRPGDEVVLSEMEHHSNLVPWQQIAKRTGAQVRYIRIDAQGKLDLDHAAQLIGPRTRMVSVTHVSNVLGTVNPVQELAKLAHAQGALICVDGAQSVPHMAVDVRALDCDFYAFSGHKMLGPTGIGVLYGKRRLLEAMEPFLYGGDMISEVTLEGARWNDLPWKFEAGTAPIAPGIGLGVAVEYLQKLGMQAVHAHEQALVRYALEQMRLIKDLEIYGPEAEARGGVVSFNLKGIHPHDMASILDQHGVAIRGGHHCAMPLMRILGVNGTCRASFYVYNTVEEIDVLIEAIGEARRLLHR
ncbi:MAG: cysteine desulfurase [Candidatus Tectimicrobiota bacterium]|nr:MAG: cysteine desulfurase [Candidatus Tectomicrobia bacterium]